MYEQELLKSPNSKKIKNSLIYKLDTKSEANNVKRLATMLTKYTFNDNDNIKNSTIPNPRDGHTAHLLGDTMVIFGGDRNRFPYNDLFTFKFDL